MASISSIFKPARPRANTAVSYAEVFAKKMMLHLPVQDNNAERRSRSASPRLGQIRCVELVEPVVPDLTGTGLRMIVRNTFLDLEDEFGVRGIFDKKLRGCDDGAASTCSDGAPSSANLVDDGSTSGGERDEVIDVSSASADDEPQIMEGPPGRVSIVPPGTFRADGDCFTGPPGSFASGPPGSFATGPPGTFAPPGSFWVPARQGTWEQANGVEHNKIQGPPGTFFNGAVEGCCRAQTSCDLKNVWDARDFESTLSTRSKRWSDIEEEDNEFDDLNSSTFLSSQHIQG